MRKVHLGIFRQVGLNTGDSGMRQYQTQVDKIAAGVQKYYRDFARHVWDVQVRGYVMKGTESTHPPIYARNDVKTFMQEHDMQGFEPNYFQVHGGHSEGYCGQANLGGNWGAVYLNLNCGLKVHIHEFGHNLGFGHGDTNKDGVIKEYGDSGSVMGSTTALIGLTSPHIVQAGWPRDREILEVTDTQQVLICPLEMNQFGMHEKEHQHIIIKKSGFRDYHLSLRKNSGTLYPAERTSRPSSLYVHEVAAQGHAVRHLADLKPTEARQLPNGVTVMYHEYKDETARVDVRFDINVVPTPIPMPVGFPQKIPGVILDDSHSGIWYNKYYDGQGFDIHIHDGVLVLYWYTFNENESSRRFYFGRAEVGAGLEEFDIFTTRGGTWEDPTEAAEVRVGSGQLYFFDTTRGVFSYNMPGTKNRGSIEITPVAPLTQHQHNGIWYQPNRNGEGFTFQVFEDMGRAVAFWYSYGPPALVNGRYGIDTMQRWYSCEGELVADGSYDLTVYEAKTGRWNDPDDVSITPAGSANMKPLGNKMIFNYDINTGTVEGEGTYTLEKLF